MRKKGRERQKERSRKGILRYRKTGGKSKGAVITLYICNNYIFSKEMLEDTSFRQSTHKPPRSCLCGRVSCQSKQGTPTGLQVQQAVSQTTTNHDTHGELLDNYETICCSHVRCDAGELHVHQDLSFKHAYEL